jgi:hypothetical protein
LALSASKEIEPGFRAMLLQAEGLFRLDVTLTGDTMRTVVRNLSPGRLHMSGPATESGGLSLGFGSIEKYEPGRVEVEFALGDGSDRVEVAGTIATLRFKERGTVRVTAQVIVRRSLDT